MTQSEEGREKRGRNTLISRERYCKPRVFGWEASVYLENYIFILSFCLVWVGLEREKYRATFFPRAENHFPLEVREAVPFLTCFS